MLCHSTPASFCPDFCVFPELCGDGSDEPQSLLYGMYLSINYLSAGFSDQNWEQHKSLHINTNIEKAA